MKSMHEIASKRPRYGMSRVARLLRDEGWEINHKRENVDMDVLSASEFDDKSEREGP